MATPTLETASFLFPTNLGWMALAWSGEKAVRLTFGHPSAAAAAASLGVEAWSATDRRDLPSWVDDLVDRLQRYSDGETISFDDIPVDLSHLTAFQLKVVRACRKISRGRTRSYGELAAAAGSPGASRAVGSVMAKNRLPIIIPCHRVVGSAGSLGGFSAPDGLCMKERMLALEGADQAAKKPRNTLKTRKRKTERMLLA